MYLLYELAFDSLVFFVCSLPKGVQYTSEWMDEGVTDAARVACVTDAAGVV